MLIVNWFEMAEEYFLGVDGGATKTSAIVIDSNGKIVAKYVGNASNFRAVGEDIAIKNLQNVVYKSAKDFKGNIKHACFGLADADTKKDLEQINNLIKKSRIKKILNCPIVIANDIEIVLSAIAYEERGIAVIGGTGCNFYGVNGTKTARASGLGDILTDEGSAYDIGLKVLRAAVRSYDGRNNKTLLEKTVFMKANVKDARSLKDVIYRRLNKTEIAKYAPLAGEAADKGDQAAKQILVDAANEYVIGIRAIMNKLKFDGQFDIVFTGSLFTKKVI